MADGAFTPISVFYSYSHKDEDLRLELEAHLAALRRSGLISEWHDRMIDPGQQWKDQIDQYLDSAQLILFLISSDFINSGYCMDVEVARARERHKRNEAILVPIILRPVLWQVILWLEELQALPKNALPIVQWSPRDLAYVSVCEGILRIAHRPAPTLEPRRPSSSRARKRFFDTAIPAQVPVNKPSALLVMVRRSDSPGLVGVVQAEPEYHMSGEDVKSKPATLHFPTQDGVPQPLDLTVKLESPQFEPKSQTKTIHVPPKGDSQPHVLLLQPTELGDLTLNVELTLGSEQIASCMLRTVGVAAELAEEPPRQSTATSAAANLEEEAEPDTEDIKRKLEEARGQEEMPSRLKTEQERRLAAERAQHEEYERKGAEEKQSQDLERHRQAAEQARLEQEHRPAEEKARLQEEERKYAARAPAAPAPGPTRIARGEGNLERNRSGQGQHGGSDAYWSRTKVGVPQESSFGLMKYALAACLVVIAGGVGSYVLFQPSASRSPTVGSAAPTEASLPSGLDPGLRATYEKAGRGDPAAMYSIAIAYSSGEGAKKDDTEATKWFSKAADAGLTDAMYELGVSYANGRGVPQNYGEAATWFRKAADAGDADAMVSLGKVYENGYGVTENRAEAIAWYRKAAVAGNQSAKQELDRLGESPQ
jgi:TPR repeat protein